MKAFVLTLLINIICVTSINGALSQDSVFYKLTAYYATIRDNIFKVPKPSIVEEKDKATEEYAK